MFLDNQSLFMDNVALTAVAATYYSSVLGNIVDVGAPKNLGSGDDLKVLVQFSAKSGTTPAATISLEGADDSGFSTNLITIAQGPTVTDPAVPCVIRLGIPSHTLKRFYRLKFITTGTTPSFTVLAGFATDEQTTPQTSVAP
jgi:hypothetical protein